MKIAKALVLAAGKSTRLGRLGEEISKPMLRVGGRPVLERHIRNLTAAGVSEIWVNLHHRTDLIRSYFKNLRYSFEEQLLGSAGALRRLSSQFQDGPFFVVYGDNLADLDYAELAERHRGVLTMLLHHRDDVSHSGVVELDADGRIRRFQEKPAPGTEISHWVNAGVYTCEPAVLDYLPEGPSDFARDIFPNMLDAGCQMYGVVSRQPVYALDTPELLARADPLGVAQIGAGRIGALRVATLDPSLTCVSVTDPDLERARAIAESCKAESLGNWKLAIADERIRIVSIATPNYLLAPIAGAALQRGRHVLVEKPAALASGDLEPLVAMAQANGLVFQAGFNYRFHPAMLRARELVESGVIGCVLHGSAQHGHGGRLGLESEWRARPELSGGGELLDQGVHVIDLFRWLCQEEIVRVQAILSTQFWPIHPLEDHALVWIESARGQPFSLEVSLTQWKNRFTLELVGESGSIGIEGLGGSYGPEKLTLVKRPAQFGVPEIVMEEFRNPESCWRAQWEEMVCAIRAGREPNGSAADALAVLRIVEACRLSSDQRRAVRL